MYIRYKVIHTLLHVRTAQLHVNCTSTCRAHVWGRVWPAEGARLAGQTTTIETSTLKLHTIDTASGAWACRPYNGCKDRGSQFGDASETPGSAGHVQCGGGRSYATLNPKS